MQLNYSLSWPKEKFNQQKILEERRILLVMLQMDESGADTGAANESKQDLASPSTIWLHLSFLLVAQSIGWQ